MCGLNKANTLRNIKAHSPNGPADSKSNRSPNIKIAIIETMEPSVRGQRQIPIKGKHIKLKLRPKIFTFKMEIKTKKVINKMPFQCPALGVD